MDTAQSNNNSSPQAMAANGYMVSGPTFPGDNSTPAMPTPDPVASTPSVTSSINISATPIVPPAPVSVSSTPASQPAMPSEKSEEEKLNPLEALAKKLAELKSELIVEEPESKDGKVEDKKEVSAPDSVVPTPAQPAPVFPPFPMGNNQENVAAETLPDLSETKEVKAEPAAPVVDLNSAPNLSVPIEEQIQKQVDTMVNTAIAQETLATPTLESTPAMPVPNVDSTTMAVPTLEVPKVEEKPAVDVQKDNGPKAEEKPVEGVPNVDDILMNYQSEIATDTSSEQTSSPVIDNPVKAALDSLNTPQKGDNDELVDNSDSNSTNSVETPKSVSAKYPIGINKILDIAIERDASDVLISVGYPVMVRVDGSLISINEQIVSPENAKELIYSVLSEQKTELLEVNREVDLAYTHQHGGEARFRINAFYTRENLAAAFRLIPTKIRTIEELQLPQIYNQFANLKQGLVLVTGPTGHGKSTTLAGIIQSINANRAVHILTIEDPIEYIFPKARAVVDQREMHDDTHSWTVALKSALRQNPDVILVGEMRDYETISAAITLAETGHLVFATLHTNSAAQTIDRIIDVFPENQQAQIRTQLASIIEAVVAQRLIPIDGGGRRAVSEILIGTTAVKNLVREGRTHQLDNVIRTGSDVGMVSLEQSLVKLVREGLITMDKAQEYAVNPEEIVRLLKS